MLPVSEADFSTHSMIALYPDAGVAARLAVEGGLAAGDLHCTVVYTGRVDAVDEAALRAVTESLVGRAPIDAMINGVGRFSGADGEPDVLVALVDAPALEVLRRDALAALAEHGIEPVLNHGYTAHMTRAYVDADDPTSLARIDPIPVTFTTLAMEYGDERTEYVFNPVGVTSAAEVAWCGYNAGRVASGGPLTERVQAGGRAAVALAETDPGRAGLWESSLRLGHLEGTWAVVFERRDALHATTRVAVQPVWADLVDAVDVEQLVGDAEDTIAGREDTAENRAGLVLSVTGFMLGALRAVTAQPRWEDLRTAVRDAVAAAHAEGAANAAALAADKAGGVGFDHATAHTDALSTMDDRDDMWSAADAALHAGLAATARAVARRLVTSSYDGGTTADLTREATDVLTTGTAMTTEITHALDKAFAGAMWALYQLGGIDAVDFVTVGDGAVCQPCLDIEDKNPWSLFDAPAPPIHPGCRCVLDAVTVLPASLFTTYLMAA